MSSPTLTPEYIAENSKGQTLEDMTGVMVLASVFVALRLAVRHYRQIHFGIVEWLILASLLFTWGLYAVCVLEYRFGGLGRHIIVVAKTDPQALKNMSLYFYVADYFYAAALATAKLSILAMYWRIFPTQFIKLSTRGLGFLVVAWWLGCILVTVLGCQPVRKTWDPLVPGTCLDKTEVFMEKAIPSFSTDFLILFLPLFEVSKLHVKTTQKFGLAGVFLLGALACASSVVRFKVINKLNENKADPTYILPDVMVWTVVEPCAAIVSGCLPLFRPVLTMLIDRTGLTRLRSSFSRFLSSNKAKKSRPSDNATFGGSGQKKHPAQDDAAPTVHGTSTERLQRDMFDSYETRGSVESMPFGHEGRGLADVEQGQVVFESGKDGIPMQAIQTTRTGAAVANVHGRGLHD